MSSMQNPFYTPWKIWNAVHRMLLFPAAYLLFVSNGIRFGRNWKLFGLPVIQKHRLSDIRIGKNLNLRSSLRSNPLGINHPVVLCTWMAGAIIELGDHFAMSGGVICAAEKIVIGNRVVVGANSIITDTDFHPLDPQYRLVNPQHAKPAPIVIEDDVFIGMNCLILKGINIGYGSVIGAGSVVTRDVPSRVIVTGNPAGVIRQL